MSPFQLNQDYWPPGDSYRTVMSRLDVVISSSDKSLEFIRYILIMPHVWLPKLCCLNQYLSRLFDHQTSSSSGSPHHQSLPTQGICPQSGCQVHFLWNTLKYISRLEELLRTNHAVCSKWMQMGWSSRWNTTNEIPWNTMCRFVGISRV